MSSESVSFHFSMHDAAFDAILLGTVTTPLQHCHLLDANRAVYDLPTRDVGRLKSSTREV